jgi:hypothetical protein
MVLREVKKQEFIERASNQSEGKKSIQRLQGFRVQLQVQTVDAPGDTRKNHWISTALWIGIVLALSARNGMLRTR